MLWGQLCDDIDIILDKLKEKNVNTKLLILIISPPGDLQIGLQALLTTHLDVDVLAVGEGSSAIKVIEGHHPTVVILDNDLPKDAAIKIVQDIKSKWLEIICIVLVNDEKERHSFLDMGTDLIVIKGLSGAKLIAEINRLLDLSKLNMQENLNE